MSKLVSISPEIKKSALSAMSSTCDVTRSEAAACDITRIEESPEPTLEALAAQFQAIAKVSDDYAIDAAFLIKRMRTLVDDGAAGVGVTWFSWARKLDLPAQRIQRYLRIADAKNPRAKRDDFLRQDRERAKKSRSKRKIIDPDRADLIEWARKAQIGSVTYILGVIAKGRL